MEMKASHEDRLNPPHGDEGPRQFRVNLEPGCPTVRGQVKKSLLTPHRCWASQGGTELSMLQ